MEVPWPYGCFMWEQRELPGSFVSLLVNGFSNEYVQAYRVPSVAQKQQFSPHTLVVMLIPRAQIHMPFLLNLSSQIPK